MSVYSDQYGKRGAAVGALLEFIAGLEDSQLNPDRDCYARNRTLAAHITTSKRTAQRYVARLRSLGHIEQIGQLTYGHDRELRLTVAGREILAQAATEKDAARGRQSNSGRGLVGFRGDTGAVTVGAGGRPAGRGGASGDAPSRSSVHPVPDPVQDPRDLAIARLEAQVQELTDTIESLKGRLAHVARTPQKPARVTRSRPATTPPIRVAIQRNPGPGDWPELVRGLSAQISPASVQNIQAAFVNVDATGTFVFGENLPEYLRTLLRQMLGEGVRFQGQADFAA